MPGVGQNGTLAKDEINVPIALSAFRDNEWNSVYYCTIFFNDEDFLEYPPLASFTAYTPVQVNYKTDACPQVINEYSVVVQCDLSLFLVPFVGLDCSRMKSCD